MTILQTKQKLHECWMQLTKDGKDEELAKAVSIAEITLGNYDECLKADLEAALTELKYDLYHALCHEIHGKEDCPCTNQTTSCLATFRVCDADEAIDKVIQQKINALRGEKDGKRIC